MFDEMVMKRETIGKYMFVISDDESFYWFEVYENGNRIKKEPIVVSNDESALSEYESLKKEYLG